MIKRTLHNEMIFILHKSSVGGRHTKITNTIFYWGLWHLPKFIWRIQAPTLNHQSLYLSQAWNCVRIYNDYTMVYMKSVISYLNSASLFFSIFCISPFCAACMTFESHASFLYSAREPTPLEPVLKLGSEHTWHY